MVLYDGHVESKTPRFGQVADRAHQEFCGQIRFTGIMRGFKLFESELGYIWFLVGMTQLL